MSHSQDVRKRSTNTNDNTLIQHQTPSNNRDAWRDHQYQQPTNNSNPFIGNASTDKIIDEIKQNKTPIPMKTPKDKSKQAAINKKNKPIQPQKDTSQQLTIDKKQTYTDSKTDDSKDNNYGWASGWSLEKEFMKQSLNISIKPQNEKYLHAREMDINYPREKYRRRRGDDKKHVIYWGQRKLLLLEIEFLTYYINICKPGKDGYKLIVYAGAAPGKHIPILMEMYSDIIMHLYDPNDFCNDVKHINRIKVNKMCFTDEIAKMYSELGRDILFISDIRTSDLDTNKDNINNQTEKSIQKDNELQMQWTKTLSLNSNLIASMIKFRMPYPHLMDSKWHNQLYLDGIVKFSIWGPVTSTETRLYIRPNFGTIKQKIYNCKVYEEQLFWFNVKIRQSVVNNSKYYCPEIGVINSYDCWAECLILEQYFVYYKQMKMVNKKDVIDMVNKISNALDKNRCLLNSNADAKLVGSFQSNVHGLIGYEGILYINTKQTKQTHDDIINELEECGMDTWIFPVINPMPKIERIEPKTMSKYGWNVLPCYNRPLYNMISIKSCIYLIPLNGFSNVAFKIAPQYQSFYQKCFGNMVNCCIITGFLIDNCDVKSKSIVPKFELSIIDILLPNSYSDDNYTERKKQIKYIINNYEQYKHMVTEHEIFKYMPLKLRLCPLKTGGKRNMLLFKNKIVKHGNEKSIISDKKKLEWNDVYFDSKKYKEPPNGYYFDEVALNSRIGSILWINNQHRNILLDGLNFSEC